MSQVTKILNAIEDGDPKAAEDLLPIVYDELRKLAANQMAREAPGQTLQATALVHEAYIRLVDAETTNWQSRNHFFVAAAEAMRRIRIERARKKKAQKYGGGWKRIDLSGLDIADHADTPTLLVVNEALDRLSVEDRAKAELVKLRFFVGLTNEEAAKVLGISLATAKRHWNYARAWLYHEIENIKKDG